MFMTRSLNVIPKTTEHHLIAFSDKSVGYVTNIEITDQHWVFLKPTTYIHEASCGLVATAKLLVF